jgi:effector-binding domain-containing protein
MSEATQSRRRITLSVDDTVQQRDGKVIAYCYHWYSGRFHKTLAGQNILAVTIKIGSVIIPLVVRLVAKQGRANTEKPQLLVQMLSEVIDFFSNRGIEITDYPITFDSWYGSQPLREELETLGFSQILVHAKSSYVFTIKKENAKLAAHKATVVLDENAWGCSCPVCRVKAESPTFGKLVLLFFKDGGKLRCMMVFGRPLRGVEILSVWHQHHGIEQFWRNLKSHVQLHQMRMRGRDGAYASLAAKVLSYLLLTHLTLATGLTVHQIVLLLSGQRTSFGETIEHFHQDITTER